MTVTAAIRRAIASPAARSRVFVAKDFAAIGSRAAIDQALSRLVKAGNLKRIARGMYAIPSYNPLLKRDSPPSLDAIVDAVARRDDIVVVPNGAVDASRLGLTTVVPGHPVYLATTRSRCVTIAGRRFQLKKMPNWLSYWNGRAAAPIVRAIHWLGPTAVNDVMGTARLKAQLSPSVVRDLKAGIGHLPAWMQDTIRPFWGTDAR